MHKYVLLLQFVSCFQLYSNDIIQQALHLQLPVCDTQNSSDIPSKLLKSAWALIRKAEYQEALKIVIDVLNTYPAAFEAQVDFAAILGDLAYVSGSEIQDQMFNRSKQLFEKLMQEVDKQPISSVIFCFKNEYCWRFAQYEQQYDNGVDWVNYYWQTDEMLTCGFCGYYSQGVGAAYSAKQLMIKGETEKAKIWAQKAIVAWAQYFSYNNTYYNAYVHYALALGILGYTDEMMKALSFSANLIHKDLNYKEFQDVIEFVESV